MDEEIICINEKNWKDKSEIFPGHIRDLNDSQAQRSQEAIQSRRQALARARQQNDGLGGTKCPNRQKVIGQSISTKSSSNENRRRRIISLNSKGQQQNKISNNHLSNVHQPLLNSIVPESVITANVQGKQEACHNNAQSDSFRLPRSGSLARSSLVLHISEGMDIKKAIEAKRNETYYPQKTAMKSNHHVVTVSDSDDEEIQKPTETIPDYYISLKPLVKGSEETKTKSNKVKDITERSCEGDDDDILEGETIDLVTDSTSSKEKRTNTVEINSSKEDSLDDNFTSNIKLNPFYIPPSEEEVDDSADSKSDDEEPSRTNFDQNIKMAESVRHSTNVQESTSENIDSLKQNKSKINSRNKDGNKNIEYLPDDKCKKLYNPKEGQNVNSLMNLNTADGLQDKEISVTRIDPENKQQFLLKKKNKSACSDNVIQNETDLVQETNVLDHSKSINCKLDKNKSSRATSSSDNKKYKKTDGASLESKEIIKVTSSKSEDDDRRSSPIFVEEVQVESLDILEKVAVDKEKNEKVDKVEKESINNEGNNLGSRSKRPLEEEHSNPVKKRFIGRSLSPDAPSIIIEEIRPAKETVHEKAPSNNDNLSVIIEEPQPTTSKLLYQQQRPSAFDRSISLKHSIQNHSLGLPFDSSTPKKMGVVDCSAQKNKKRINITTHLSSNEHFQTNKKCDHSDLDSVIFLERSKSPDKTNNKIVEGKDSESIDISMLKKDKKLNPETVIKIKKGECYNVPGSIHLNNKKNQSDCEEESSGDEEVDVRVHLDMFLKACGSRLPGQEYLSVRSKLNKYWNQIPAKYAKSNELANFIEMKWALLDSDSKTMYVQIRDVMTRLKELREGKHSGTTSSDPNTKQSKQINKEDEPVAGCSGLQSTSTKPKKTTSESHKRKLQKALEQCANEIHKLENAEIDFDDEENSVYILEAKYKKRYMAIYRKLAEYDSKPVNLDRQEDKDFKFEESKFPEINTKITKFVNRSKEFPDFIDIKELVKDHGSRIKWSEKQIHGEAEKIFQAVGKKLIRRRRLDEYDTSSSYIKDTTIDPARKDASLDSKLKSQTSEGKKKIQKVFEEFVEKQYQDKEKGIEESGSDSSDISCDDDVESGLEDVTLNIYNKSVTASPINNLHENNIEESPHHIQIDSADDINSSENGSDDGDSIESYSVQEVSLGSNDSDIEEIE